jgi:hypothetical protein
MALTGKRDVTIEKLILVPFYITENMDYPVFENGSLL